MDVTFYENNLNRKHEWIRAADGKVSIWIAFQGIIVTIATPYLTTEITPKIKSAWIVFLAIISTFVFSFSLFKSISAITPRLKNKSGKKSILYFGDIAEMYYPDFESQIIAYTQQEYEGDLRKQIYIASQIALRKHKQFRASILSFFISFILVISLIFLVKR